MAAGLHWSGEFSQESNSQGRVSLPRVSTYGTWGTGTGTILSASSHPRPTGRLARPVPRAAVQLENVAWSSCRASFHEEPRWRTEEIRQELESQIQDV